MKEGVGAEQRSAFRSFSSSRAEVEALVEAAIAQGGESFAVVHPRDGYGRAMLRVFTTVLERRGHRPRVTVDYDPQQTSFAEQAEALAGERFDALFIPDRADRLALLAPALAAAGIWSAPAATEPDGPGRAVQYLVPSIGFSPDLSRRAGRYLQGALFATSYRRDATSGSGQFAARFESEYAAEPTHYGAFGHDAVLLVAAALSAGARGRAGIRSWLARVTPEVVERLPLAAPFAGFDARGQARARAWLATLIGDEFVVYR
jgi:ABC-type branched-subunit amino acid transport system substrate-binding protein